MVLKDGELAAELCAGLSRASLYLGDSESLVNIQKTSTDPLACEPRNIGKGTEIESNTLTPDSLVAREWGQHAWTDGNGRKPTVLLMQNDPIDPKAELRRYLAPLIADADDYLPLSGIQFTTARPCMGIEGAGLCAFWEPVSPQSPAAKRKTRGTARKSQER